MTQITAIQTFAIADGTFTNGWKWIFDVTVPDNETLLKMKFADWISGTNSIPAASNIRFYSAQSSNASDADHAIVIGAANTYSDTMNLDPNQDLSGIAGRQIQIIVEARVPVGSAGGSYSTSYGINTDAAPVITRIGDATVTAELGLPYEDLGATAWDNNDGDITGRIATSGLPVDTSVLGSHTVAYNVSDLAGNPALEVTRTVNVTDTLAPVGGDLTWTTANHPTPTAVANDGNLYTIVPALTGTDHLTSLSVVVNDAGLNTSPVPVYIDGSAEENINGNMVYGSGVWTYAPGTPVVFDEGVHNLVATFSDNSGHTTTLTAQFTTDKTAPAGGELTVRTVNHSSGIIISSPTDGVYTVTPPLMGSDRFTSLSLVVTDADLNTADAPVNIEGSPNGVMHYSGSDNIWNYVPGTPVVFDEGSHDLVATFADNAGNTTTLTARFTTDRTVPTISLNGDSAIEMLVGDTYTETAAANDNIDGNITSQIVTTSVPSPFDPNTVGTYTLHYNVLDSAGNAATEITRTVNVNVRNLTITPDNQTKVYDTSDPIFTYATSGDPFAVGDSLTGDLARASGNDVGVYDINSLGALHIIPTEHSSWYNLTLAPGKTLTITLADQTITFNSLGDKTYGDADFDVGATASSGLGVSFAAGGACTITDTTVHITGAGSCTIIASQGGNGNYNAAPDVPQTFTISQKGLSVIGVTVVSPKTYDSLLDATLNTSGATLSGGIVGSDDVSLDSSGATGTFADKNVENDKPVTVFGFALAGAQKDNYSLTQPTGLTANITQKDLTVTATGVDKPYDGTPTATVTLSTDALVGDIVTPNYTNAAFTDANVGTWTVNVSGISISGLDSGNYNLLNTTASTLADITALPITVTADNQEKSYGTPDPILTYNITTGALIGTDLFTGNLTRDDGTLPGAYAIRQGTLTAGTNYDLAFVDGTLTIKDTVPPIIINTPADMTVEATGPGGAVVDYTLPTATDDVDTSVTVNCAPPSGSTFALSTTTVNCNAHDTAGNNATETHFDVGVVDTTAPDIILNGSGNTGDPTYVIIDGTYTELGATATDIVDGTDPVTIGGDTINTSVVATYHVTYNAVDVAGNHATEVIRTVNIIGTNQKITISDSNGGSISAIAPSLTNPTYEIVADADYFIKDVLVDSVTVIGQPGLVWITGNTVADYTFPNVTTSHTLSAVFDHIYTLTYSAGDHGSITGNPSQNVDAGSSGSEVTAVADGGYHFTSWSDGVLTASRTDTNVTGNISVTANFAVDITPPDSTPPPAPTGVFPTDGATLTTAALDRVDWSDVTDDASNPVTYIYEVSNSPDTSSDGSFVTPAYTSGTLSASEIPTPGTLDGTYYWHVRAIDSASNSSAWSITYSFIISGLGFSGPHPGPAYSELTGTPNIIYGDNTHAVEPDAVKILSSEIINFRYSGVITS